MGTRFICYYSIGSVFVLSARGRKITNEFIASLLNLFLGVPNLLIIFLLILFVGVLFIFVLSTTNILL